MDIGHIANLVLAAHSFRDFEENLLLVADVYGKSTVITTPFLIFPDLLKTSRQSLHSMLEFSVRKILGAKIGICVHSYFGMANNRNMA